MRNQRGPTLGILGVLVVLGCTRPGDESSTGAPLFQKVAADRSGITFANVLTETDSLNIIFNEYFYNGSGVAIGDINNDGLSDIFFGGNMVESRLYMNKGNLSFEDVTTAATISTDGQWVTGVSMVDINQDNLLDIYVCVGGGYGEDYHNLLFINESTEDEVKFTERATPVGLDNDRYSVQSAFLDYDGDGDLDAYLLTSALEIPNKNTIRPRKNDGSVSNTDRLYRNEGLDSLTGLPHFTDVSREAGIQWDGFGLGVAVSDVNRDGWPDVYVANDYLSNDLLYINQKNGTFREQASDYLKHQSYNAMGVDIADFNNDGLADIVTLDMLPPDNYRKKMMAGGLRGEERYRMEQQFGYAPQVIRNCLQLNQGVIHGTPAFSEIGQLATVAATDWSWSALLADFDNDGHRDLLVTNGIPHDITNLDHTAYRQQLAYTNPTFAEYSQKLVQDLQRLGNIKLPNVVFRNQGDLTFEDKSTDWGFTEPTYSNGAAYGDLDNDGDLDLVINNLNDPALVLENTLNTPEDQAEAHFLSIDLVGSPANRKGVGATVTVFHSSGQTYYEHFPTRGFLSSVDYRVHLGLGSEDQLDSLKIRWPDGRQQVLTSVVPDQRLTLRHVDAELPAPSLRAQVPPLLFSEVTKRYGLTYEHQDQETNDFAVQPLLLHSYSQEGPGLAAGDVNGDGRDDLYVGAAPGHTGQLYVQAADGSFSAAPLRGSEPYADVAALFFDADGDDDLDLYVVSGGARHPVGSPNYRDRLYLNDGRGNFTDDSTALPKQAYSGGAVVAADYDHDGDLDLFVTGRTTLPSFPQPERSVLLRNESEKGAARFRDVTDELLPGVNQAGILSAALWSDFNQDGWPDLLLAGEWMPLTFWENQRGIFTDVTARTGLAPYSGWWNSLTAADFDGDGDVDYVVGNQGLNNRFTASQEEPIRLTVHDFDRNGSREAVSSHYVQGENVPLFGRDRLKKQLPYLQKKFTNYHDFAQASFAEVISPKEQAAARVLESRYLASAYVENQGNGTFALHALPTEAQFAPISSTLARDFDQDGFLDVLVVGNAYGSDVASGPYDASIGLLLRGDGCGGFTAVPGHESGFMVEGEAESMALLSGAGNTTLVVVSQYTGPLKAFGVRRASEDNYLSERARP